MEKFDITQSWYLPVLNNEKKFIGFISKTKLLISTGKFFLRRETFMNEAVRSYFFVHFS